MPSKTILFISETPPINTSASSVIFYRHFRLLEKEGFLITWITDKNSYDKSKNKFPSTWDVIVLPNRAWYLPPYRASGFLQSFRFYCYLKFHLKNVLETNDTSIIVTFLHGTFLSTFAAYVKEKVKLPLVTFLHDNPLELSFFHNKSNILRNVKYVMSMSDKIFAASDEFKHTWKNFNHKFTTLYPIPESYIINQPRNDYKSDMITFGYSGTIYKEIIPVLLLWASAAAKFDFKLIIVGDNNELREALKQNSENVSYLNSFDTPNEANKYIIENCNATIIAYPDMQTMPWIAQSFPSKFLQYCQLELPVVIVAPKEAAVSKWCLKNNWLLYSDENNFDSIKRILNKVKEQGLLNQVQYYKYNDFNPHKIHNKLLAILNNFIVD